MLMYALFNIIGVTTTPNAASQSHGEVVMLYNS